MSTPVVVTGHGLLCAAGDTSEALFAACMEGRASFSPAPESADGPFPVHWVGAVASPSPEVYLEVGNPRPLDRTGRLATAAAGLALQSAQIDAAETEVGLVLGTMFGSVGTISRFDRRALTAGPLYASPLDFANTVINAAAGQTAIWHHLTGINATLAGGPVAGLAALAYAAESIRNGRQELVLAGGADELTYESSLGFLRAGLASPGTAGSQGRAIPFAAERDGFAPAEGAALLVLESEASAQRRGGRVLGRVLGHASGFDPSQGADAASATEAFRETVLRALEDAGQAPAAVALVSTGANGTAKSDAYEAQGLLACFPEAGSRPPWTAVKSVVGECLGAAGPLQILVALQALRDGRLPGVARFAEVDPTLGALPVAAEPSAVEGEVALVTAVGFDGQVTALVVGP